MKRLAAFLAVLICSSTITMFAQPPDTTRVNTPADERMDIRVGVFGGGVSSIHRVNFFELPGLSGNTTAFYEGAGVGGYAGFMLEVPFLPWLHVDLRGNVLQQNGTLKAYSETFPVGTLDGNVDEATFQRTLEATLATAGGQLLLGISPVQNLNIYLGTRANLFFIKSYTQIETLLEPSYGRFENGLRTRNAQSGGLPIVRALGVANLGIALMGGISYEFPVNAAQSITIAPEVFAARGITNVIQARDVTGENVLWQIDNLQAALAVRWYPARSARFNAEEYQLKKLMNLEKDIAKQRVAIQEQLQELRTSGISAKITEVVGISADGKETPNPTVRVEEFRSTKHVQLLPYVFFNDNSFVIPMRYKRLTASEHTTFRVASLDKLKALDVYYALLNIIGKRMEERPAVVLTVTGCAVNVGVGTEPKAAKLADQRAQAVSDYLQDVWKITAKRIVIQRRTTLDVAANDTSNDAATNAADNRRVELSSDDASILAPVEFETTRNMVNPPTLRLGLNANAGPGLKQWELEIAQFEGREVRTLQATAGGNTIPPQYTWNIDADERNIPAVSGSMDVRFGITDIDNRNVDAPILAIPVEVLTLADRQRKGVNAGSNTNASANPNANRINTYTIGLVACESQTATTLQSIKSAVQSRSQSRVGLDSYSNAPRSAAFAQTLGVQNSHINASATSKTRTLELLKNDASLPEGRAYNNAVHLEVQ
jgi:outer membrane protein OmpA-like peptidoglycan-associated protein